MVFFASKRPSHISFRQALKQRTKKRRDALTTKLKAKAEYITKKGTPFSLWKVKEEPEQAKALLKDGAYRAIKGDPLGNSRVFLFFMSSTHQILFFLQVFLSTSACKCCLQGVEWCLD